MKPMPSSVVLCTLIGTLVATTAHGAGYRAKVDALTGAGGVTFRESLPARKDAKSWHVVVEKGNAQYLERSGDVPAFMGTRVDKIVVVVGKKSQRVAVIALQLDERPRCQALRDALDRAWGPAAKTGERSWQWMGEKVDASLDGDPAGDCTLYLQDRGWNDADDTFR